MTTNPPAPEAATTVKAFQLRGRFFTAIALRLSGDPDQAFFDALDVELARMPHFFDHAPFVIDLEQVPENLDRETLEALIQGLKRRNLSVFGVQNGTDMQTEWAKSSGLLALPVGREAPLERVETQRREADRLISAQKAKSAPPPVPAPAPKPASLVITEPVRSGQKLFADRGDLVVVGPVSQGAELVAAGNIHVYGPLRGRALAGVNGDTTARIFCQSLDADLLAIAGLYLTYDDLPSSFLKRAVQAYLENDKLRVDALG